MVLVVTPRENLVKKIPKQRVFIFLIRLKPLMIRGKVKTKNKMVKNMFLTCVCDVHCWYMYSPLVSFFPVAYLSCSKTTTVLGRLGGSAMFFKHLIIWKFARVHLQNAGWHSIFTLLRSSANVRHDFFILHVCSLRSVLFRADTSSMHCSDEQKFTRSPKISF